MPRSNRRSDPEPALHYRIRAADPAGHYFDVSLVIEHPDADGQRVALPAWIPGSYMIREFSRHVVNVQALSKRRPVPVGKIDKHTWQAAAVQAPLEIRYRVYAWDLSVRGAHLDTTHGFFNGTSVFLRVLGQERQPCSLTIDAPAAASVRGRWRVATTLAPSDADRYGFGRYRAADYDELVDHPVEMGDFALATFNAGSARHEIAITGRHDADLARLQRDLAAVCSAQVRLFEPRGGKAPVDRYLFLVTAVDSGYGGLEHRASTALLCSRNDLPHRGLDAMSDGYQTFLGLASHEYFHTWHVKRIKPAAFADYDFDRENYTRLLWIFEGFTSYYDDLMLVRSGLIDEKRYLSTLARTITQVVGGAGRHGQSVAESSFDAWIKYYRQDENSPNTVVSYYAKGSLVALALDLTIRGRTAGRRSLDDVMRLLWRRFGRDFDSRREGLGEDEFPALLHEATGLDLRAPIRAWAYGTRDLPLARLLAQQGVSLTFEAADPPVPDLGLQTTTRGDQLVVGTVHAGRPAASSGLSAGDLLVALDGLRIDARSWSSRLSRLRAGDRVRIHAFRRDELMEFDLRPGVALKSTARLSIAQRQTAASRRLRQGWIGRVRSTKGTG